MSPWHLLWIIPLATMFGFFLCAVMAANKDDQSHTYPDGATNKED